MSTLPSSVVMDYVSYVCKALCTEFLNLLCSIRFQLLQDKIFKVMSSGLSTTILVLQVLSTFIGSAGFSAPGCILCGLDFSLRDVSRCVVIHSLCFDTYSQSYTGILTVCCILLS